ncbi:MAG: hypothetical protein ACRD0W_20770, partial [Acidimicrobiales bacterium]
MTGTNGVAERPSEKECAVSDLRGLLDVSHVDADRPPLGVEIGLLCRREARGQLSHPSEVGHRLAIGMAANGLAGGRDSVRENRIGVTDGDGVMNDPSRVGVDPDESVQE